MARKKSADGSRGTKVSAGRVPMREFSRSLPMSLLRAREAVMRQFRPSLRRHDLTEQQWRILRALAAIDAIEVTELARTAFLLGPSLSRILRDLDLREGAHADEGGGSLVGSYLRRHHPPLWRQEARRVAGHARRAGGQPD